MIGEARRNRLRLRVLDSFCSEQIPMLESCEHLVYIRGKALLGQLGDLNVFQKGSAALPNSILQLRKATQ